MEYIILIVIFLVLGVIALKAGDVMRNIIHLGLIILIGAFVWYKVAPYIFNDTQNEVSTAVLDKIDSPVVNKVENAILKKAKDIVPEDALNTLDQAANAKPELVQPEFVEEVIKFNKYIKTEFLHVIDQRIEQAKQEIGSKVATINVPKIPKKEVLEAMTTEEKKTLTDQVVQFLGSVPKTVLLEERVDPEPTNEEEPMQLLLQAQFKDEFSVNQARGKSSIFRLPDGTSILRLEDFQVTAGPDLHVYLSVSPIGDVDRGFVDLGPLKATSGSHNYPVSTHASPYKFQSVVIFSQSLMFPYAIAPLR